MRDILNILDVNDEMLALRRLLEELVIEAVPPEEAIMQLIACITGELSRPGLELLALISSLAALEIGPADVDFRRLGGMLAERKAAP